MLMNMKNTLQFQLSFRHSSIVHFQYLIYEKLLFQVLGMSVRSVETFSLPNLVFQFTAKESLVVSHKHKLMNVNKCKLMVMNHIQIDYQESNTN